MRDDNSLGMRLFWADVPGNVIDALPDEARASLLEYLRNRDEIVKRNLLRFVNDEGAFFNGTGDYDCVNGANDI